jgi:polysaccharide export outer membrane protein
MEPGMGLSKLISMAGGFTDLADEDRVTIRRKTKSGVKIATVSYDDIRDGLIPEVQLQSGDYVEVSKSAL